MQAFIFLFLSLITFVFSQNQGTYQCYQCVSAELMYRWHLTMLPSKPSDSAFRNCTAESPGKVVACNGPCLNYIIEDPDEANRKLIVRDCQSSLTQIQPSTFNNGMGGQRYCEYDDNFKRPNSLGNTVTTRTLVERCINSTFPCNTRLGFPNEGNEMDCNDSKNNNTVSNQNLNCYDCDETNDNCKRSKCSKKYCVKSIAKIQGTYSMRKFCSDVNPFGQNEVCSSYDYTVTLMNMNTIGGHSTVCYCKDKQYCNTAGNLAFGISTVLMLIVAKILSE